MSCFSDKLFILVAVLCAIVACSEPKTLRLVSIGRHFAAQSAEQTKIEPFEWAEGDDKLWSNDARPFYALVNEKKRHYAACVDARNPNSGVTVFSLRSDVSREEFERYHCQAALQKNQTSQVIGTFRHQLSCMYSPALLLQSFLAREIGNPGLYAGLQPAFITRKELAELGLHASQTLKNEQSVQWNLILTFLKSSPLGRQRDTAVRGVFIERNPLLADFREFEAAEKQQWSELGIGKHHSSTEEDYSELTRIFSQRKSWSAYQTPSWKTLLDRRPIRQIIALEKRSKAIQLIELMADLADLAVIDAIGGQRDPRARVETSEFLYTFERGKLVAQELKELNGSEKREHGVTAANSSARNLFQLPIKRLQIYEPGCAERPHEDEATTAKLREIKHLRRTTYFRIQALARALAEPNDQNATQSLGFKKMQEETFLTHSDMLIVSENLKKTSQILKRACLNRTLKLDLDVKDVLEASLKSSRAPQADQIIDASTFPGSQPKGMPSQACEENLVSLGASAQSR